MPCQLRIWYDILAIGDGHLPRDLIIEPLILNTWLLHAYTRSKFLVKSNNPQLS